MLGALVSLTNAAELESVRETITKKLQKKYGSKGSLLSGNLAALERGQKEVH
jgi:Pyruvate/2-oxoacid:ferredoxin oxidoreductase gamma subunit